jgi:AcrR family transcriptional regulator
MLDTTTDKGRILTAALECAARKSWAEVTLLDIADAAHLPLGALRGQFNTKDAIIAGLLRAADDEVLRRAPKRAHGQEPRDALFDIVMSRFDVLAPHKAALKSIYMGGSADPTLAGPFLASMHWMLQAAGIGTDGLGGGLRVSGLALVYAQVFRVWLDDDDAGLARTMAALDRRLRRGERTLHSVEQAGSVLHRFATDVPGFLRSVLRGRQQPTQPPPAPDAGPTTTGPAAGNL